MFYSLIKKRLFSLLTLFLISEFPQPAKAENWVQSVTKPNESQESAMCYDPNTKMALYFGGSNANCTQSETWAWNSVELTWIKFSPNTSPPARRGSSMAFDPISNTVILFGGEDDKGTFFSDTWSWNGTNWAELKPNNSPLPRAYITLAYDKFSGKLILFGGYSGSYFQDTWEWDGSNWNQLVSLSNQNPPSRAFASMAFDNIDNQMILFGGSNGLSNYSDTWIWKNNSWEQLIPESSPTARQMANITTDESQGNIVLYGGKDNFGTPLSDTWIWNGNKWLNDPSSSPPARCCSGMVFDNTAGNVVLFGGFNPKSEMCFSDTWIWNGSTWSEVNQLLSPSNRYGSAITYDKMSHNIILFSGSNLSNDTWIWRGMEWQQVFPLSSPEARTYGAMCFNEEIAKVILFGGHNEEFLNDMWTWDGSNWTKITPKEAPTARNAAALTYFPPFEQMILFGGEDDTGVLGDTWEWNEKQSTWKQLSPTNSPLKRKDAVIIYDPTLSKLILFGGTGKNGIVLSDTWSWNGITWEQIFPEQSPSGRTLSVMAYDLVNQRGLLFGGESANGSLLNDTWSWDGYNWAQLSTDFSPAGRNQSMMAFNEASGNILLFGGDGKFAMHGDTWIWGIDYAKIANIDNNENHLELDTLSNGGDGLNEIIDLTAPFEKEEEYTPYTNNSDSSYLENAGSFNLSSQTIRTLENIPMIEKVFPGKGSTKGGTLLIIQGSGFKTASAVKFGKKRARNFKILSDHIIQVYSPNHPSDTVYITVFNDKGSSSPIRFQYQKDPSLKNLKGHQTLKNNKYLNVLKWKTKFKSDVAYYLIYRNNSSKPIGHVNVNSSCRFIDHKCSPNKKNVYRVFLVDNNGKVSESMKTVIQGKSADP